MTRRFIQRDGKLYEIGKDFMPEPRSIAPEIMPDITPYKSMLDGSAITSRSHHREHLRQHGCIEVGNDSSLGRTERPPLQPPPGLKEQIAERVYSKLRYK